MIVYSCMWVTDIYDLMSDDFACSISILINCCICSANIQLFKCLCAFASNLKAKIVDACLFRDWFSLLNNHIKLIISFNLRLKDFYSIFGFFISLFVLKISIFWLCMMILCYFSSFLMLLASKICFHIALCASNASAIYFFEIINAMLFFFCV